MAGAGIRVVPLSIFSLKLLGRELGRLSPDGAGHN